MDDAAVTVVLAAEGYPTAPRTGDVIEGLDRVAAHDGVTVFAAGVAEDAAGRLVTAGGRVLAVTGTGPDDRRGPRPGLRRRGRDPLARRAVPDRHRGRRGRRRRDRATVRETS